MRRGGSARGRRSILSVPRGRARRAQRAGGAAWLQKQSPPRVSPRRPVVPVVAVLSVVALAACAPPSKDSGSGGLRRRQRRRDARRRPTTSAGWTRWSRPPRRRASSTSSRCPRTGPTTPTSSRASSDKYGIKVTSQQPDAGSQDEIDAAKRTKGTDRAPDVFDLGQSVALANTEHVREVQGGHLGRRRRRRSRTPTVPGSTTTAATWRSATTRTRCPTPASIDDLLKPAYKGKVALNGDPTDSRRRLQRRADGGGGQGRLGRRHRARCRLLQQAQEGRQPRAGRPDPGDHQVGPDAGRDRLGLHQRARTSPTCRAGRSTRSRTSRLVGGFYYQAINADAPHPAAARLWQEYLYSDEGQNLWLAGGARPVRADAMVEGRHDRQGEVRRPAEGQRRRR